MVFEVLFKYINITTTTTATVTTTTVTTTTTATKINLRFHKLILIPIVMCLLLQQNILENFL